jgi:fatty acyl-CoA reductase
LLTETSLTPIQKFYSGCSVFVTGGTGFLGTILIEKLLRSCSDLSTIYVLARNKKGKNLQSRIDELFDQSIFDRLKEEFPKFRHKVVAIGGDCGLPDLGISLQDRQMLINEVGGERIGKKSEAEERSKNRMIF